ncbi:hypothetical protein JOM56_004961 [Amanita muscaria]
MNWQTLTPEFIFEILSKFLPGLAVPVVEPEFFPWYLGHICSSWRAVFKSYPQFWSTFIIRLDWMGADRYVERALLLTEMCIQRSQTLPLTFQFRYEGMTDFEYSYCHKILKALMAQSTRWLNAYFHIPRSDASLLYAVKTQLPILRTFRLTYCGPLFEDIDLPQCGDLFEDAPHVRHVYIVDYPAWKLNWSSITTLHLEFTNVMQPNLLVNFLQTIDRLEELFLDSWRGTSFGSPPRIVLPFLRCLGICTKENLLFETPALEELHINTFSDISLTQYYVWAPEFVGLLNHLKRLVILLTSIEMTIMIFQYLPDTENIDFYVMNLSILKILPLCPSARHLETMTIGISTFYDASYLREVLDIFEFWRMHSNAATGFGRFERLKRFTLKLQGSSRNLTQEYRRFESELTSLLSERGVQCSIIQFRDLNEYEVAILPFDIFGGQEFEYLL